MIFTFHGLHPTQVDTHFPANPPRWVSLVGKSFYRAFDGPFSGPIEVDRHRARCKCLSTLVLDVAILRIFLEIMKLLTECKVMV